MKLIQVKHWIVGGENDTEHTHTRACLAVIITKGFCMEESSATACPKQSVYFTCSAHGRVLPLFSCTDKPLEETTKYL